MNTDNIHTTGARDALMRGIKKAKDAIAGTLGPTGYSLVVEDPLYPGHAIVDDGFFALERIKLADPLEQRGVELLKEAVRRSNKESGDGSTTSCILTAAILEEGLKQNMRGKAIKDSLDECLPIIEKSIDDQTKQITPDDVAQVATISSGDPEIGKLLQEIYQKIGKDGIVELDNSGTPFTSYEIVDGVRLRNCGFLHELMTNDGKGKKATMENPKILITRQPINVSSDIDPLLQTMSSTGDNKLVIFYKEISDQVLQYIAQGHVNGLFNFLLIKAPTLWQDWLFEDFAKITGATIIDQKGGTSLRNMKISQLGTCEKIVAHKDETLIFGTQDITTHLENLKDAGKTDDQQLLRASWLQTKTAILKVGASSETELSLKRLKVEDARNASYQALQHGVVVGAGKALLNVIPLLPDTTGGTILKMALRKPYEILVENMGTSEIDTTDVVDPAIIPKNAIRNALSVAGTILTSDGVITLVKEK